MRKMIACLCVVAAAPAHAGESAATWSVASEQAWSGLAGDDTVPEAPPELELQAGVGVLRWLSLDAMLVWSRDARDVAAGARLSGAAASFVLRARQDGGLEMAAGTSIGERLELELGLTSAGGTDVLLKAAVRY